MRRIDTGEMKRTQLEILDVVAKFCDDHEIKYWLDAGTLLGAVRHKGYIPWDDDIDVGMLRPDYDKFLRLFNGSSSRYKAHSIENDPDFALPFCKVMDTSTILYEPDEKGFRFSINIDIWVFDNAPDDDAVVDAMFRERDEYRRKFYMRQMRIFGPAKGNILRRLCAYGWRILKKTAYFYLYCLPYNYYSRKIAEIPVPYMSVGTKRIASFMGWAYCKLRREVFDEVIDVEFEGRKYKAPKCYDEWLSALYGDYMQLPPEEERVTHHAFMAFKE